MHSTITVSSPDDIRLFYSLIAEASTPSAKPLDVTTPEGEQHLVTVENDTAVARCSLWWRATPQLDGMRLGYIGHFAARADGGAFDLLEHACRSLAEAGCAQAVGPIDGNTWRRYRFVTERGDEPPFFLEPDNPDQWPQAFRSAGFDCLAHYASALEADVHSVDPRVPEIRDRMQQLDIRIRQFEPQQFDAEVDRIFDISSVSFRSAFLYSPIERSQCHALYEPLKQYVRAELAFIAEQRDRPVGFVFAIPDWAEAQRGARIETAIVKTIAILPDTEYSGLGALLLATCRARIAELGYTRTIHALMHDGNAGSRRLSDRFGRPMRGYTLFARDVTGLR